MSLSDKIKQRLLKTFKIEANEHIRFISNQLILYEKERNKDKKAKLIEEIFRSAHSLKGAARAVGQNEVVDLCQSIENLFSGLKKGELNETPHLFDAVLKGVRTVLAFVNEEDETKRLAMSDLITEYVDMIEEINHTNQKDNAEESSADWHEEVEKKISEEAEEETETPNRKESGTAVDRESSAKKPQENLEPKSLEVPGVDNLVKPEISDQIRISIDKIEKILLKSEELLPNKQALEEHKNELASLLMLLETWRKKWRKKRALFARMFNFVTTEGSSSKHYADFSALLEFLEYNEEFFSDTENFIEELQKKVQQNYFDFSNKLYQLNEDIRSSLLLPFNTLTNQFPLMIRDISQQMGKEIIFSVEGDSIEIDKRVLEELKDPFVHLLRNSIDHGIETPDEREKMNKERAGNLSVKINSVEGNNVEIIIEDDGRGIDPEKIKNSALQKKIISEEELNKLTDEEILNLIFESDLSTAKVITDLSGRGLGLAIVKEKVIKLGGSIELGSRVNVGTVFKLTIPLTVSTVRGLLIRVGNHKFFIKISELVSVIRVKKEDLISVEKKLTFSYLGTQIGLVNLSDILSIKENPDRTYIPIAICKWENKLLGIAVSEILGEQEIFVKSFNTQIKKLKYYEAATISSGGSVIPILNVKDIFGAVSKGEYSPSFRGEEITAETESKNILVVDDSITSRLLLKDILETSGYRVKTAVDGKEAWTELRTGEYDLVVSDVEMPRMNGFELTKAIKTSEKYSKIPVVLVTALSRREDMEKGIDVGADAYIVKSDFEQSNLLDTVRRLI